MNKLLRITVGLAAFAAIGTAVALNSTIHAQSRALYVQADPTNAPLNHKAAAAAGHSAFLAGKPAVEQDRRSPRPPMFHMCQQQDPTTIPAGLGSLGCYPLAY